jgi:2'-5' RNA ligase
MLRLFVGLALPDDLRRRLAGICAGVPGARWVAPENLHITLRFIGEVAEPDAQALHDALGQIRSPGFSLELLGADMFASGRQAKSLWLAVSPVPELFLLQERVEAASQRAGLTAEGRKFKPHVTLARLKDTPPARARNFVAQYGLYRAGPFAIDHFTLFASNLSRHGASYSVLAEYGLG